MSRGGPRRRRGSAGAPAGTRPRGGERSAGPAHLWTAAALDGTRDIVRGELARRFGGRCRLVPHERPDEIQTYENDIRIPNINCDKCILQVIQWMADHAYNNPGGYSYQHCANLAITANPDLPIDTGWPEQM